MYYFKFDFLILILLSYHRVNCETSFKRICVDEKCKEPISLATTLLRYSSPESGVLSFSPKAEVKVFSKYVDSEKDYWEVEINGKRGFVPQKYIKEYKILKSNTITLTTPPVQQQKETLSTSADIPDESSNLPTVGILDTPSSSSNVDIADEPSDIHISTDENDLEQKQPEASTGSQTDLSPDKVKDPYEVVDGTTIFLDHSSISPSSTVAPVHSTSIVEEAVESVNASNSYEGIKNTNDAIVQNEIAEVAKNVSVNLVNSNKETENPNEVTEPQVQEAEGNDDLNEFYDQDQDDDEEDGEVEDEDDEEENEISDIEKTSPSIEQISETLNAGVLEEKNQANELNLTGDVKDNSQPVESTTQPVVDKEKEVEMSTIQESTPPTEEESIQATTEIPSEEAESLPFEVTVTPDPLKLSTEMPLHEWDSASSELAKQSSEMPIEAVQASSVEPAFQNTDDKKNENSAIQDLREDLQDPTNASINHEKLENEKLLPKENISRDDSLESSSEGHSFAKSAGQIDTQSAGSLNHSVENIPKSSDIENNNFLDQQVSEDTTNTAFQSDSINTQNIVISDDSNSKNNSPFETESIDLQKTVVSEDSYSDNNSENKSALESERIDLQKIVLSEDSNKNENSIFKSENFDSRNILESEDSYSNKNETKGTSEKSETAESSYSHTETQTENISEPFVATNENIVSDNPETIFVNIPAETHAEEVDKSSEISEEEQIDESGSLFSSILAFFGSSNDEELGSKLESRSTPLSNAEQMMHDNILSSNSEESQKVETGYYDTETCKTPLAGSMFHIPHFSFNYDLFLYLTTSAISCIIFLVIYLAMDNNKKQGPLIAKINQLEKELVITLKENEVLQEKGLAEITEEEDIVSRDSYDLLNQKLAAMEMSKQNLEMEVIKLHQEAEGKQVLEQQIEMLEKELETSTEVGMELNRIISEMLDPTDGSDKFKENVEQLQRQLLEQKVTIEEGNNFLIAKEAENVLLRSDLETSKIRMNELLRKLDDMVEQISKIEADKKHEQKSLQDEVAVYQQKYNEGVVKTEMLINDIQMLKAQLTDSQRQAELRIKEYTILKDSLKTIKSLSNDKAAVHSLLDATSMRAELHQLKIDNENHLAQLKQEQAAKISYEKKCQALGEENQLLMKKYQEAEKEKVEVNMKLEVLNNYFKKKEEELQGEILRYKSIWNAREGEATSTTERIKLMQEEIENYKSQNEILKQEIISQEIDLKSQISMLEKKVHENWVNARQTERKLEDAKQEAAQLRNRITLSERNHNRLHSPLDHNGESNMSATAFDSPSSPPPLFGAGRGGLVESPPSMPGMPPFLPPPPLGAPFLPPPPHGMPFMPPPPPGMYPGDHRPPPLGRLSSPPPMNRYSPDSSAFSPYDRNSPSPPYDSEYGASPPPMRRYSPYERDPRRDFQRMTHTSNGRSHKGSTMSSGSDHSIESLDKLSRKQSKMV